MFYTNFVARDFFYTSRCINKNLAVSRYTFGIIKVKLHIRYQDDFPLFALIFSLKTDSDTLSSFLKKIRFSDLYRMLFSLIYKLTNFPDGIDDRYSKHKKMLLLTLKGMMK